MHPLVQLIIHLLLISYAVFSCLDDYPSPAISHPASRNLISKAFDILFIIEQGIKLYGLGLDYYRNDSFNRFDLTITGVSSVSIFFDDTVARVIGAIRILRLFRLILKKNQIGSNLNILAETYFQLLPIYIAFFFLFSLNIYVFAIIGMNLFQDRIKVRDDRFDPVLGVSPRSNFDSLSQSLTTVFSIIMRQK